MPVACQSRGVTEPQREKDRLNWIADKIKALIFKAFIIKRAGTTLLVFGGFSAQSKKSFDFFDKLK